MDNLQVAELCFEAAIKCMSPDSFDSTIAIDLSDKSEYILNRALAQVLSLKGAALNHSGRYEEAIINCSKVIELDPKCAAVFNNRGAVLYNLGRYEEAFKDYSTAIELDPKCAAAFNNRGAALNCLGRYEEAAGDFYRSIELGKNNDKRAVYYSCAGIGKSLGYLAAIKSATIPFMAGV